MLVIDTSVAMAWCFEDEATPPTDAVLDLLADDRVSVPSVWPLEVSNVLLVSERRGRVTEAQSARFLELLAQLPIDIQEPDRDLAGLISTGRRHALSSYDASYLVLAERLGAPLATLDKQLAKAARRAGVPLLIKA